MRILLPLAFCLSLTPLSGQAQIFAPAPAGDPSSATKDHALLETLLHAQWPELVFHAGDTLSVQVYGIKDYALQQQVAGDGTVAFPLIGKLKVDGLTVQQTEQLLASALSRSGMVRDPQVTVTAVSRPSTVVTVSGDVVKPGVFPAYVHRTLMDYLSEAGGLVNNLQGNAPTNSVASTTVTLIRPSLGAPVRVPLGSDAANSPYARLPILPGDEIRVGQAGVVYAIGAFKTQGSFPLKNTSPTTVLQLVAMAGGIGYEADRKDAHLIRTEGDLKYILDLNVDAILKGKVADIALKSDDILFVPTNQMKAAIKGGGAGFIVAIASAYIYAHP
jgi:polysaccharide export outer membrane protein